MTTPTPQPAPTPAETKETDAVLFTRARALSASDFTPLDQWRFWSRVEVGTVEQCWPWRIDSETEEKEGQRGAFVVRGRTMRAYRCSVVFSGRDIPEGMVCDHVCRNGLCVNPYHIRIVTISENTIENSSSPSALNAVKTHCRRGHEYNADNTRLSMRHGSSHRHCRICEQERWLAKKARLHASGVVRPKTTQIQ